MTFVVAEIGVNWDGNFELAKEMISKAKQCGCNAVKFQAFDENIVKDHPERDRLMKSTITKKNIETINELASSVGIEWFCTPMYPEAVDLLDEFVTRFKVRMADSQPLLKNKMSELLKRIFKTGKETLVSTQKSPRGCKYYRKKNIKWLYVVPKYPCSLSDLDFRSMQDFDGYSNHCPHILAPLTAAIIGSKIIEVHITSNKAANYIDNSVSFNYDELTKLVNWIRLSEQIHK